MNEVTIMVGDALSQLATLPDNSIHCCVTSPPYWGLRSYQGDAGMIGLEPTFDDHLANLVAVFREVKRVLRDDGICWLNYGDAYWGGKGASNNVKAKYHERTDATLNKSYHHVNQHGGTRPTDRRDQGFKPKDLILMPARVAMALQADGANMGALSAITRAMTAIEEAYWDEPVPDRVINILDGLEKEYAQAKGDSWWIRSEIIWHKPNPMPESVTDRPTSAHEKVYLLAKSSKYFYDAEAVREPHDDKAGPPSRLGVRTPRIDSTLPDVRSEILTRGGPRIHHPSGRNRHNVWKIATYSFPDAHFATFPPKLVEPCIKAGTSQHGVCAECGAPWGRVGERTKSVIERSERTHDRGHTRPSGSMVVFPDFKTTGWQPTCTCGTEAVVPARVLDPFGGSGTTGMVAVRLGRNATLVEISSEYAQMAKARIEDDNPLLVQVALATG